MSIDQRKAFERFNDRLSSLMHTVRQLNDQVCLLARDATELFRCTFVMPTHHGDDDAAPALVVDKTRSGDASGLQGHS